MKFQSSVQSIYVPTTGQTVRFKRGSYKTEDPAEIALLSDHPRVTIATSSATRDELNEVAREAGVAGPENLPNKDAVEEAIEEEVE